MPRQLVRLAVRDTILPRPGSPRAIPAAARVFPNRRVPFPGVAEVGPGLLLATGVIVWGSLAIGQSGTDDGWRVPPALRPGDTIALVAPSGVVKDSDKVHSFRQAIEAAGFRTRMAPELPARVHHELAGTDAERAAELNAAFRDPEVRGVFAVRGGYGLTRILDTIDYEALRRDPKVVTGYSDLTALHLAVARSARVVTFHSPVAGSWLADAAQTPSFAARCFRDEVLQPLTVVPRPLPLPPGGALTRVVGGRAEGRLCGGNLSLVCATLGTPYAIEPAGRILFLEDVNEAPYRVDRMLSQLRLAGVLDAVAGVVVGRFSYEKGMSDDPVADEARVAEILREYLTRCGKPAVLGFPVGHVKDNATLPHGARVRLDADAGTLELLESPCGPPR